MWVDKARISLISTEYLHKPQKLDASKKRDPSVMGTGVTGNTETFHIESVPLGMLKAYENATYPKTVYI